jgi:hypothetical protein
MVIATNEKCQECRRTLNADETAYLHRDRVLCPACWFILTGEALPAPVTTPPPIAGWLLLPLIVLSAAGNARIAFHELRRTGHNVSTPLEFAVVAFAIILVLLHIIVGWFFFKRKRKAPKLMVALYSIHILFSIFLVVALVFSLPPMNHNAMIGRLLIAIIFGVAWIAYFKMSRRVRVTFIR